MTKVIQIKIALIFLFFGFSALTIAQETKSDVSNDKGEVCSYLQYPPKEGDLFNRGEMLPVTTVWFEDFACMDDTEENRMRIIDAVARSYGHQGTDFVNHKPKVSRQEGHGDCYESADGQNVTVSIYYLYDTESIQGYVHSQPKGLKCIAAAGRGGPGGPGGPAGMGGMGTQGAPNR